MMLRRPLALAVLVLALGAGLWAPARADHTFWTVTTGGTPQPLATGYGGVNIDYIYYPCQNGSGSRGCMCGQFGQRSGALDRSRGCFDRDRRHHHPHSQPAYPFTPQRPQHGITVPPAPAPMPS
ncbi:MAG TPA: hypothetical protein VGN11_06880 [Candidatus Baltobacteraceae bacterium]|jgi:hypothetical protein|nr:hypothetical protein [Candidatus Baltobacteraceae bacterium]